MNIAHRANTMHGPLKLIKEKEKKKNKTKQNAKTKVRNYNEVEHNLVLKAEKEDEHTKEESRLFQKYTSMKNIFKKCIGM